MIYEEPNIVRSDEEALKQQVIDDFKRAHPRTKVSDNYINTPALVIEGKTMLNQTNETTGDRPFLYTNNDLLYRAMYYQLAKGSFKDPKPGVLFTDQNFYDWVSYANKLQKAQQGNPLRGAAAQKAGTAKVEKEESIVEDVVEVNKENVETFDFTYMDYYALKRWLDENRNNLTTIDYGKAQSYWNDFIEWGTGRGSAVIMKALMKLFLGIWTIEEFNRAIDRYHTNESYLYRLYDTEIE